MREWITSLVTGEAGGIDTATPLRALRYVVVDTELTSLDRGTNRLLSLGAVAMEGTSIRLGEQFYRVLNPGVEVPAETVVVHGLRPADIEGGERPEDVLRDFEQYIRGAVLVGHFVRIDRDVLRKEFAALGWKLEQSAVCTARVYRWLDTQRANLRGLDESPADSDLYSIAAHYGLPVAQAHHALDDAYLTAQVWQRLLVELEKTGIRTLKQLLRIARN
jgi:DNA polymerase III subunit epsilon